MTEVTDSPAGRYAEIARQLLEFVSQATEIDLPEPGAVTRAHGPGSLVATLDLLDSAIHQLRDLADVYSDSPAAMEQLMVPIAALIGEYLRSAVGAEWIDVDDSSDDDITILLPTRIAVDLHSMAQTALRGGVTARAMVESVLETEPEP